LQVQLTHLLGTVNTLTVPIQYTFYPTLSSPPLLPPTGTVKRPKFGNGPLVRHPLSKLLKNQSEDSEKKILGYPSKKILFRVCSVTTEMFKHRNSGENRRKGSEFFSKIYEGHIRIWFR
jgi:hypothetical protein